MREALYFDSPAEFCDFVKSQGDTSVPSVGELYEFHRIIHPDRAAETALVLFNCQNSSFAKSIHCEIRQEKLYSPEFDGDFPITQSDFAKTLIELVTLVPWPDELASKSIQRAVYFLIESEKQAANLIRDSLKLDNDRIQYGIIESPNKPASTLLRIENPSYFLIQRCSEDLPSEVSMFYPIAEDLFAPWGFHHPLQDWWLRSEHSREGKWVFFTGPTEFVHLDPVIWRDAYDLTDLKLDFQHRHVFTDSTKQPQKFEVTLRPVKKATDESVPELWLLDEAGKTRLENTLQITDDDSLRSWQLAAQKLEGRAEDWIFIRESGSRKKGTKHHDFGGIAFSRYRGINDLLLPIGYDLQPPLRRDAYRELFKLQAGFITILIPESDDNYIVAKVSERAFDSLSTFIDYLVERDSVELNDLMARSVFDLKEYLKAPKHPGLLPLQSTDDGNKKRRVAGINEAIDLETSNESSESKADATSLLDQIHHETEVFDESKLGELEKQELNLERQIASQGQDIHSWLELLVCKNKLGKTTDALICAIEALWISVTREHRQSLRSSILTLAEHSLNETAKSVTIDDQEWKRRAAVFAIAMSPPDKPSLDQWVSETTAFLKEQQSLLRAKERWLAWGEVLKKNKDERRQAQLREDICDRITEHGLGLEETPSFIRARIFLDRKVEGESGSEAVIDALANLEVLQTIMASFKAKRLSCAANAILARAYSNLGNPQKAEQLLTLKSDTDDPCAQAWESLFRFEALRSIDQSRASTTDADMNKILERTDSETKRAIEELRDTYRDRGDDDNPAAFLARENRSRTYPRGPRTEQGELYQLSIELENHVTTGNEIGAVSVMRTMMTLENKKEYDNFVKLPQFVETIVAGLERFKWGDRGSSLIPLYEEFTDRVPGYLTSKSNDFYGSILHSNLAHGLLVVENMEKAIKQIAIAANLICDNLNSDLDFIDAAAALIRTIEQLPLNHRRPFLKQLIDSFALKFDQENTPYLVNERLFAVLARSLDQMAEAATSKDKISLQQFRSYQLQDEFIILQRIQQESFID